MEIKISNVAKVLEAEIVANGITVIAGENNTGKSTILKAFYMAENTFRNSNEKVDLERKKSLKMAIDKCEIYFDENGYEYLPLSVLDDFYHSLCKNLSELVRTPTNFEFFKKLFDDTIHEYSGLIQKEAIYSEEFLKPIFDKVKSIFARTREDYMNYIAEMFIRSTFADQLNNSQNSLDAQINIQQSENKKNFLLIKDNKIEEMSYGFIDKPDVIYLPAYNMLDYLNIDKFSMLQRNNYSSEQQMLNNLFDYSYQNESYEKYTEIKENIRIIKEILEEVVHGRLKKGRTGELSFEDNELDMLINTKNVASGIKNFLIIQTLVENGKLKRDSILLIDEPETNLHPKWHLIFAEILVLMYKNMGVISIVNSHSPYFIRALEVKMADHGIKDKGTYYLMEKKENKGYIAKNVTEETNKIYEKLYKPLEYL